MSSYRLDFIQGLMVSDMKFAPRNTVWHGTAEDALEAHKDRCKRIFQVLLTEAGPVADEATVDRLWVDAQVLVSCGRDLQ